MNNNNKQNSHKQNGSKKIDSNSKKDNNSPEQFHWKKAGKTSFVWILIIISAIFMSNIFSGQAGSEVEIQYSEYRAFLTR